MIMDKLDTKISACLAYVMLLIGIWITYGVGDAFIGGGIILGIIVAIFALKNGGAFDDDC
jgi:hypothetical protein